VRNEVCVRRGKTGRTGSRVKERDDADVSFGMFAASSTSKLANANCLESPSQS
jgi:hypothetical protein